MYDRTKAPITRSESCYDYQLLYPCLQQQAVVEYNSNTMDKSGKVIQFVPGEIRLECFSDQLAKQDLKVDHRYDYNADAIFEVQGLDGITLLLHETSGKYASTNKSKRSQDDHKGMFGLLSLLKDITDKYRNGSVEAFMKSKVFFTQSFSKYGDW